ncbi:ferrous iron transport protein A [Methyloceanibacter sp. wino2]|uniref:FeoA family protein n=1 Tax=Methyloceanibacter sp. wino2 TaxID=2170729 RepID=UPI001ABA9E97|nr:ferrous iron transport protein A [Methyloceanibacter sp. wino2]
MAATDERVKVVAVSGDQNDQRRLFDLGIVVGKELTVTQRQTDGRMVVGLGDLRLALGVDVTRKILVVPVSDVETR